MIFYFTGTGNSRYIAERIAALTSDEIISINDKIKRNDTAPISAQERLIFVLPTYAWRIPTIVENWIQQTDFPGAQKAWFVMNCGSEIGNAAKYNQELCAQKQWTYMGTAQIIMPENYIAMFSAPGPQAAKLIIENANPRISDTAKRIAKSQKLPATRVNLLERLMSGPVNKLFYSLFVKAKAFRADSKCISCGKCVQKCPLNNISLKDVRPVWGKNCTHCMACICYCPTEAIEYGKKSVGKVRYHLET